MGRLGLMLILCGCAFSKETEKHSEGEVAGGRVASGEQDPGEVKEYRPPTYPGQPLQDRLAKEKLTGAKKWGVEDWQKGSWGADEHVDVDVKAGPPWWVWLVGVGAVALAGYGSLKTGFPSFLGPLWKLLRLA